MNSIKTFKISDLAHNQIYRHNLNVLVLFMSIHSFLSFIQTQDLILGEKSPVVMVKMISFCFKCSYSVQYGCQSKLCPKWRYYSDELVLCDELHVKHHQLRIFHLFFYWHLYRRIASKLMSYVGMFCSLHANKRHDPSELCSEPPFCLH